MGNNASNTNLKAPHAKSPPTHTPYSTGLPVRPRRLYGPTPPPIPSYAYLRPNPSRPVYGSAAAHPVLCTSAAAHTLWCTVLLWGDAPTETSGPLQADGPGPALGEAATRAGAEPLSAKMAAVRCTRRYGQRRSQSHARDLALERAQHELESPHVLSLEFQLSR